MHSPFAIAFTSGAKLEVNGQPITLAVHALGELQVPSGRICVSDPFLTEFSVANTPLRRAVPPGNYPVELALAQFENDQRVACARVRIAADKTAVQWEIALFEGQDDDEAAEQPGYGVDAGTGCFFDASVRGPANDEATGEAWLAAHNKNYVDTWSWHIAPLGDANVVSFSSGWGDGVYASWWGFDENGEVVELVTDFDVLAERA